MTRNNYILFFLFVLVAPLTMSCDGTDTSFEVTPPPSVEQNAESENSYAPLFCGVGGSVAHLGLGIVLIGVLTETPSLELLGAAVGSAGLGTLAASSFCVVRDVRDFIRDLRNQSRAPEAYLPPAASTASSLSQEVALDEV